MTPQQLLEEVKGRFIILFHSDESALTALLRQSLGKFQEKAGIIFSVSAESATIPLPPDYWRTAMVGSHSSIFCHVGIWNSTKLHGGRSMICLLLASGEPP